MIATNAQSSSYNRAISDLGKGTLGTLLWLHLAWLDIKQRYKRSVLGPFWMTLSMGILVSAMGPLYGKLFNQPVGPYFQYLVVSFTTWSFISSHISESCTAFICAESFIKQINLPLTVHLHRVLARNVIIFGHNFLVVIVVLFFFPPAQFAPVLLAPIGFILLIINLSWIGLLLSTLSARFRDIQQTVPSIMQLAFFLTPIVWKRDTLKGSWLVADANPLYHFMEIVRTPLLGQYPTGLSWAFVCVSGLLGWVLALLVFRRFRSHVVYWV